MAVHIKLIKNNIKSSSSYGKYFAKTVSQGEVTLDEIAAEACRNSGFSEGAVVGVVTELQDILKQRLTEGQTVVLPGIGRFSLRVERSGLMIRRRSTSAVISPASSVVSSLPVVASRVAISSTTSAKVSKPSGRRVLNLRFQSMIILPDIITPSGNMSWCQRRP